jgi:hypothetical protein
MDHRCDCECGGRGRPCTRTTMCYVQNVVDDLNGAHEIEIERLQARVDKLEAALREITSDELYNEAQMAIIADEALADSEGET